MQVRAPTNALGGLSTSGEERAAPEQLGEKALRELRTAKIAAGWDIDVFYCQGASEAEHKARAIDVINLLKAEQNRQIDGTDAPQMQMGIGRLRSRPISQATNASSGYRVSNNEIRSEAGEKKQSAQLITYLQSNGGPLLQDGTSGSRTAYYLSIFMCNGEKPALN